MRQAAPKAAGSVVVLIPKQLRAEWIDAMALDPSLSNNAFRVGCVIGSYFNKYRGEAYPRLDTIARVMDAAERTVWGGVKELEAAGYLIVKRRHLGTRTRIEKNGAETEVRLAGGKGVANTYQPAFQRSQISATTTGSKLAERCDLYWAQSSQKSVPKVAADCDPTLNLPSEGNPTRARGPSSPNGLGPAGEQIRSLVGEAIFASWFSKLDLVSETAEVVTLSAPGRHHREQVINRYEAKILTAWRVIRPTITSIVITERDNRK
jgi:hypothetical protein